MSGTLHQYLSTRIRTRKICSAKHSTKTNIQLNNATKEEAIPFADLNSNYRSAIGALNSISNNTIPGITFATKKQPTVSHSMTEAEYKALSDMTKEVARLVQFLKEIDLNKENCIPQLFNDNKGAIDVALSNANHHGLKTKNMDIKYHYIRDLIKNSIIKFKKNYPTTIPKLSQPRFITACENIRALLLESQMLRLQVVHFLRIFLHHNSSYQPCISTLPATVVDCIHTYRIVVFEVY
ncbi:hypothetical protein O181_047490 [Austropuccinia psidii MF-1]|uniref:Reverse transcriptase Ty1/copia-type domain-containing protein n=1 Tax=Austropuccinia psidii MF-1 TaxID=1389203 RepID=A0A9Q3HN81_9BASI|nr:hypothetical protein [Austropuccinia psidii MF-1]